MGWLLFMLLAFAVIGALWRFAGARGATLQFLVAGLLLAAAGYAWQGNPGLQGRPVPPPARQDLPDTLFAQTREEMLGRFDRASSWLTIADHYHRTGDTRSAVGVIRSALRAHPQNANLWTGLGNALVIHANGMMTPAAKLAFDRAMELAPGRPGPSFYYGFALIQSGRLDEAEAVWTRLLESAKPDADWRPALEGRLRALQQLRRMLAE
jgi:cytochrome c-type biogenesis protein CcmH/NrfG